MAERADFRGTAFAPTTTGYYRIKGAGMTFVRDALGEERTWHLVALVSAGLMGIAARKLLENSWQVVKRNEPPKNPAARSVDWSEALAWTAASGLAMGVGRLLAQRGAAAGWKKVHGRYPKGLD